MVQEGEESVARLRNQLEEVQEREEATQLQLAHAISQVNPQICWRLWHEYWCRWTRP